jgi:ribosomal protein S12 methylthiotransferase accessory factor
LLASDDEVRLIEDGLTADLISTLETAKTFGEIEAMLGGQYRSQALRIGLDRMERDGLVAPFSACQFQPEAAYWDSLGVNPLQAEISLCPLGHAGQDLIQHALSTTQLTVTAEAPFLLVTTDDYLRPELSQISLRKDPWLIAKPVGHTIWIGPLFVPGKTVCWSCLAAWIKPHRWAQAAFYGWSDRDCPPQPSGAWLQTTLAIAAGMIATTAAVWLRTGQAPELEDAILSFDTRTLRLSRSVVSKWPNCPACGSPSNGFPSKPRTIVEFLSPITGIVSAMQVTDKPVGGVFHAHAIFVPPLPESPRRSLLRPQHAAGKGSTAHEAETSCIAEALERYSLIYRGDERRIRGRMHEVGGVDPREILLFSDSQYENREDWNRAHSELHWVPQPFNPSMEIEWTEAKSLTSGLIRHIPTSLCYMYYRDERQPEIAVADTNGCAAGPTFTEAVLRAFLELIERDSVAIWWYNRLRRPEIELDSLSGGEFRDLERTFRGMGRNLHLLDLTTDLAVPSVVAVAPRADGTQLCFGSAADVALSRAAFRAIAEAAQICFWTANGSGSKELRSWISTARLEKHDYFSPQGHITAGAEVSMTAEEALALCASRLTDSGIEPYYVDLTRPEVGLSTVRAIAPGLRHFWARLASGRLYDVPVKMGWRDRTSTESEMNPTPCMI